LVPSNIGPKVSVYPVASICISHKEDVDGLGSATLIKVAESVSKVLLVDYANMIAKLERVISSEKYEQVFLCDLGLSKKNEEQFLSLLEKAKANDAKVTYFDHHDLSKDLASAIKKTGTRLNHTTLECTSVQIYSAYKKELPDHCAFFAAMGALTDYMEQKPLAAPIVSRFDRQFLMLESASFSYMISANQHNDEFLCKAVDTLAKLKYPHDIKDGFVTAERYAKKVASAVEEIGNSIIRLDNLAYAPSTVELSAGMVVNFVLGASQRPVAMVYKLKNDISSYVLSIRGSADSKVHLGRLVNDIASSMGGSGGGHDRACGAVVPEGKFEDFVAALDAGIAETT